jgi:hypothetical protein
MKPPNGSGRTADFDRRKALYWNGQMMMEAGGFILRIGPAQLVSAEVFGDYHGRSIACAGLFGQHQARFAY